MVRFSSTPSPSRAINAVRALARQGMRLAAIETAQKHLQTHPRDAAMHVALGELHIGLGEHGKAEQASRKCLEIQPDNTNAILNLGYARLQLGFSAEAIDLALRGLAIEPRSEGLLTLKAVAHEYRSEFVEALEAASRLSDTDVQVIGLRMSSLIGCKQFDQAVKMGHEVMQDQRRSPTDKRLVLLYVFKAYDKMGRYDEAMSACKAAHEFMPGSFDRTEFVANVDRIIGTFDSRSLSSFPRGDSSDVPVFVVGMPRSGTTLIEQIIASHPAAYGAGEIRDIVNVAEQLTAITGSVHTFPRAAADLTPAIVSRLSAAYLDHVTRISGGANRVVNKALEQYNFMGLINVLLPGARVIYCTRDPMDVCLSCHTRHMNPRRMPFVTDLANLGLAYRQHERLMEHWRRTLSVPILHVTYEDVVKNQERESRRIIDFLGLAWDDRCLRFWESERTATTLSYDQVNKPIYDSSIGRWKNYEKHLGPLKKALGLEG